MTTVDAQIDQRQAAFVIAVLDAVAKGAGDTLKEARTIAARDYFTAGDRLTVRDPDTGTKLGTVGMSDPGSVAEVHDEEAFTAWQAERDPSSVIDYDYISDSTAERAEAFAILREHAPDLVQTKRVVLPTTQSEVLEEAAKPGADPIPGVTVRQPRGVVSTRLTAEGREHIRSRVANGDVNALRELPAKSEVQR